MVTGMTWLRMNSLVVRASASCTTNSTAMPSSHWTHSIRSRMGIFGPFFITHRYMIFPKLERRLLIVGVQGSSPALFVGTAAFDVIVKQQIRRLEDPSLKCCQLVYDELIRILGEILPRIVSRPQLQPDC